MICLAKIFTPHSRLFLGCRMVRAGRAHPTAYLFIFIPVEVTAIAFLVFISQLEQALAAHRPFGNTIDPRDCGLGMADAGGRFQASLRPGQRLEEVRPKCPLVSITHRVKARAEAAHIVWNLRRQHSLWDRIFADLVPFRISGPASQFGFLGVSRSGRCCCRGLRGERTVKQEQQQRAAEAPSQQSKPAQAREHVWSDACTA